LKEKKKSIININDGLRTDDGRRTDDVSVRSSVGEAVARMVEDDQDEQQGLVDSRPSQVDDGEAEWTDSSEAQRPLRVSRADDDDEEAEWTDSSPRVTQVDYDSDEDEDDSDEDDEEAEWTDSSPRVTQVDDDSDEDEDDSDEDEEEDEEAEKFALTMKKAPETPRRVTRSMIGAPVKRPRGTRAD